MTRPRSMRPGRWVGAVILALVATACVASDDEPPGDGQGGVQGATLALCARLEECNLLTAISRQECTAQVEICLDAIGPRPRIEWQRGVDACASAESCEAFSECYGEVPYC